MGGRRGCGCVRVQRRPPSLAHTPCGSLPDLAAASIWRIHVPSRGARRNPGTSVNCHPPQLRRLKQRVEQTCVWLGDFHGRQVFPARVRRRRACCPRYQNKSISPPIDRRQPSPSVVRRLTDAPVRVERTPSGKIKSALSQRFATRGLSRSRSRGPRPVHRLATDGGLLPISAWSGGPKGNPLTGPAPPSCRPWSPPASDSVTLRWPENPQLVARLNQQDRRTNVITVQTD